MYDYIKMFLLTTSLFIVYAFNYVSLKETGQWLYLANFFDYNYNLDKLIFYYIVTVPFISFTLKNALVQIFPMLLSTLTLMGVLPSIIICAFSTNTAISTFFIFYIYFIFIFSLFSRKAIVVKPSHQRPIKGYENTRDNINWKIFKVIGWLGVVFYIYLMVKYRNILHFSPFGDIYEQRSLFKGIVLGWEGYIIMYSKSIAAYSFLALAIGNRSIKYIFPLIFIYFVDYLLAAHKASMASIIFALVYYFYLSKLDLKRYYFMALAFAVGVISAFLQYGIWLSREWVTLVIGLYDRMFHVTFGLFARMYDFVETNYYFYGGTGLLGKIFSGVDNGKASTIVIGEYYFGENIQANADIIADGYLNFGYLGSFMELFILWIIFNRKDNKVYEKHFVLLLPFIFIYSRLLFSTGLQIVLLSGVMFVFILLVKFGFRTKDYPYGTL